MTREMKVQKLSKKETKYLITQARYQSKVTHIKRVTPTGQNTLRHPKVRPISGQLPPFVLEHQTLSSFISLVISSRRCLMD
jgi:hypothetical protein